MAAFTDPGIVAVLQVQYELMHPSGAGSLNDVCARGVGTEARDVLGHGPVEQLDVLRQVTDVGTQSGCRPLLQRRVIEANAARYQGLPHAHETTRESGLAGRTRPDNAERLPRAQLERH